MPTLAKGSFIGPYEIVERINSGGMATIYHAHLKQSQQEVALKISQDMQVNNNALRKEVDILMRLNHPGIIRIMLIPLEGAKEPLYMAREPNLPDTPWYYCMEYLPGGSLGDILKGCDHLPVHVAAAIGMHVAKALQYIHQRNIVHLDLKPDNILLRYRLVKDALIDPVIVDFGVSAHAKSVEAAGGSLFTMSPEYIRRSRGELDPQIQINLQKVDIYALGVVMYRLWTGQYPYQGPSQRTLTSAIIKGTLPPPSQYNPELSPFLDDLLKRWLAKDPTERPVIEEIVYLMQQISGGITRVPQDLTQPKAKKKKWKFWG